MRGRAFDAWFLALADPAPATSPPPCPTPLDPAGACELAAWHGVLPALARNLRRLGTSDASLKTLLEQSEDRLRQSIVFSLVLRKRLEAVAAALVAAGIPALVLKGPEFADRLYDHPSLRPFTDLDFLLPREALGDAGVALQGLGYRRDPEPPGKYPGDYGEETWRLDDPASGAVELHWNLVNSPPLRRRCSVQFHDLQFEQEKGTGVFSATGARLAGAEGRSGKRLPSPFPALPRATPSALLLTAAVHAAVSHRFDRLQPLCDVCQAARGAAGPVDSAWLAEAARRTGSGFALATALHLAGGAFREPACAALAAALRPQASRLLISHVITPRSVLHSRTLAAGIRRQLYRELLKRI